MSSIHLSRGSCAFFAAAIVLTIVSCAQATVMLKVTPGFGGLLKGGAWNVIAVEITNTSDESIEGTLSVNHPDDPWVSHCSTEVNLPAHSRKLYHLYTRVSEYEQSFAVELRSRWKRIASSKVHLRRPCPNTDKLVVCVSSRGSGLGFLNGIPVLKPPGHTPGPSPSSYQSTVQVGSLKPSLMPDRPAAYLGADVVVLLDTNLVSENPRALEAIAMWTASGGTLIIPAGLNPSLLRNRIFQDLLPVEVSGTVDLPALSCLEGLTKRPLDTVPVTITKARVKPTVGEAIIVESGVPIVARRDYGAGQVIYIAFDPTAPPFRYWDGQTDFWKMIIEMNPPGPLIPSVMKVMDTALNRRGVSAAHPELKPTLLEVVTPRPAMEAPSYGSIGLFLVAYVALLSPINYIVLKRLQRLQLAWVTTPAVVLVFTIGAYVVGHAMKGNALYLTQATTIEASENARFAWVVTGASLFSPARRSYRVTVDDPRAVAEAMHLSDRDSVIPPAINAECTFQDVPMAMWSTRMLESTSGVDLGGTVSSRLELSVNRLSGEVYNNTRFGLTDCLLCYGNQRSKLPDIPPGRFAKVDMPVVVNKSPISQPMTDASMQAGNTQDFLLKTHAARAALYARGPVLLAIPRGFHQQIRVTNARARSYSAVRCLFRLGYQVKGTFQLNPYQISSRVQDLSRGNPDRWGESVGGTDDPFGVTLWPNGRCVSVFRLSVPTNSALTSLILNWWQQPRSSRVNRDIRLLVYNNQTEAWQQLDSSKSAIPLDPTKHVNPNNEVRLRVDNTGNHGCVIRLALFAEGLQR
ncbi:MAG: hypothetical protein QHI38_07990 [Armatimonadota bacterium]|nr:hypothetical protein [Armatimonadota bacterium]